jgi:hypothetical protein
MFVTRFLALFILLTFAQTAVVRASLDEERLAFTVPAAPWILSLPKSGMVIQEQQSRPDGSGVYYSLSDEKNQMMIAFFIEPVRECKDSKACRDMVLKAGNPSWENPQGMVQSEIGEVSYFEFFMPSFQGIPVKQQNMYAEFVKDGYWVDLHISKILYQPQDHELFERVVKSVSFERKDKPTQKPQ